MSAKSAFLTFFFISLILLGCATVEGDWHKAQQADTAYAYQNFLHKHPDSQFTTKAREGLEKNLWQSAVEADNAYRYETYLDNFPQGLHADQARTRLEPMAFKNAKSACTRDALEDFIQTYPDSEFAPLAAQILAEVKTFTQRMNQLETSGQIKTLIQECGDAAYCRFAVPKLENTLLNEARARGFAHSFVLPLPTAGKLFKNTIEAKIGENENEEKKGTIGYMEEFPGDTNGLTAMLSAPNFGHGSILRFTGGNIRLHNYIFRGLGDKMNRLTFAAVRDVGYVYLRGHGHVTSPDNVLTPLGSRNLQ